jgi:hypothetical protein
MTGPVADRWCPPDGRSIRDPGSLRANGKVSFKGKCCPIHAVNELAAGGDEMLKRAILLSVLLPIGIFAAHAQSDRPVDPPTGPPDISVDPQDAKPVNFGLTGSWNNPALPGQGFSIEVVMVDGEPAQVVVYWFTFATAGTVETNPGDSAEVTREWFLALGDVPEDKGAPLELEIFKSSGAKLSESSESSQADTEKVGEAMVQFTGCSEGAFSYTVQLGDGTEVATGEIPIERITPDVVCEELGGPQGSGD